MTPFFDRHQDLLQQAIAAAQSRQFWSPFSEIPSRSIYGDSAPDDGEHAFMNLLGKKFVIDQPQSGSWIGNENALYGLPLGISYPASSPDALVGAAQAAAQDWAATSIVERIGILTEALVRLNARSFEIGHAVKHTTGQAFAMAFQAGGPHAQDRGLEALVYAYQEMGNVPGPVTWHKPQGKRPPLVVEKAFHIRPKGIALVIGCNTFPTWNSYPGLFASLATGNTVIVKPHPKAILPLAITVEALRSVLKEAGLDPNVVTLAVDTSKNPATEAFVTHPAIGIIDFTGSATFGNRVETEALRGARTYTEKSGVNNILIDSTDDISGMTSNLALSLSLYSGQMCTTPQNLFVPKDGIQTNEGHLDFGDVVNRITEAVSNLLADDQRAAGILGAIVNDDVRQRVEDIQQQPGLALPAREVTIEGGPNCCFTPSCRIVEASEAEAYGEEQFGPIFYIVRTEDADHALSCIDTLVRSRGSMTLGAYSTNPEVLDKVTRTAVDAGVSLSCNLTGPLMVNQAAAFSDFHGSGANPAANASLTDNAFIAGRFNIVEVRHNAG